MAFELAVTLWSSFSYTTNSPTRSMVMALVSMQRWLWTQSVTLTRNVHKASLSSVRSHGSTSLPPSHFVYFINPDCNRFWLRAIEVTSQEAQRRFITTFAEYVYAVIDEASDRANGRVRDVEEYLKLTRLTAGGYPSFLAAEAGLNIPDEVMAHPALQAILSIAAESLVLTNVGISQI